MTNNNEPWKLASSGVLTTGIGSLPHPYIDAAMEFSFSHDIPFLPQLPQRNPAELMVFQALCGMAGIRPMEGGLVGVNQGEWDRHAGELRSRLDKAFLAGGMEWSAFESFEPSADSCCCWNPFLWEVDERCIRFAKIQIAGPMTCLWAMRFTEQVAANTDSEMEGLVSRFLLARSIAMVRKLRVMGAASLLFIDEPSLFSYSTTVEGRRRMVEKLRFFIESLRDEHALVGIHCCANTDWSTVLALPIDVLSVDVSLSFAQLFAEGELLFKFFKRGGRLALGIVPTGLHSLKIRGFDPQQAWNSTISTFKKMLHGDALPVSAVLKGTILTPACGLALHSVRDADVILSHLNEIARYARALGLRIS
jgi:hypothetical protein